MGRTQERLRKANQREEIEGREDKLFAAPADAHIEKCYVFIIANRQT